MSHSEQLLDSFHTFSCFTRSWLHRCPGPEGTRSPTAPAQPLLDPPGSPISAQPRVRPCPTDPTAVSGPLGCTLQPCFLSCLLPPLLQLLTGAPGWSLALILHFPCQGPLVDFVTAVVSALHSQLHPPVRAWPVLEPHSGSSSCPFGKNCPLLRKPSLAIQEWKSDGNVPPSSCSISVFKQ